MATTRREEDRLRDPNHNPLTGTPEDHPVGTGVGAVAGAVAAGAAAGSVAGPVGTLVGAAAGALAGGVMGYGVAEMIDPAVEEAYWRDNYTERPYINRAYSFDDYGPAYTYGASSYGRYSGRPFDDVEPELGREWDRARGKSRLAWNDAKHAASDAWQRVSDTVERAIPGDSDRDGK